MSYLRQTLSATCRLNTRNAVFRPRPQARFNSTVNVNTSSASRRAQRAYATVSETRSRHPPRPALEEHDVETFSAPSKPRMYYARPPPSKMELPRLKNRWPVALALSVVGVSAWAAFFYIAANQERVASSITQQLLATVRDSPEVGALLGDVVRPEPVWWLNGAPWVSGAINLPAGNVDLSFRIKGHKGAGTVYFTSIRKAKGEAFQPLRFRLITDDGHTVDILPRASLI